MRRAMLSVDLLLVLACAVGAPQENPRWIAGSHRGLTVGVSTRVDATATLGAPKHVGPYYLDDSDDVTDLEVLEYDGIDGLQGRTSIVVNETTKKIEGILLYPSHMTMKAALKMFGSGYIHHSSKDGPCGFASKVPSGPGSVSFYSYPARGVYVTARDSVVQEIGFITCTGVWGPASEKGTDGEGPD